MFKYSLGRINLELNGSEMKKNMKGFKKKGQANALMSLVVAAVVIGIVVIFGVVISGKLYQQSETVLDSITNETVKEAAKQTAVATFDLQKQNTQLLPTVFLALFFIIILGALFGIMSMMNRANSGGGGGNQFL